ncbi:MAG: HopJ type III effector protein [Methylococcaceae bacterium]
MSLTTFLQKINNNEKISFDEAMSVITENYIYEPTDFSNGLAEKKLINTAGSNERSCKIFAFANINQLNRQQTLSLFGDYYQKDVLEDPAGSGHQNIRNFMQFGWDGISFTKQALTAK